MRRFRILLFLFMWFLAVLNFEPHGYILHFLVFFGCVVVFGWLYNAWCSGWLPRLFRQPTVYVKFDDRDE